MTATGKIPTAQLRPGDVVLYATHPHPQGDRWAPSSGKDRGTYAGRVVTLDAVWVNRGVTRRSQRFYDVTLTSAADPGGRGVTIRCAPSQTWWLASASRKWRAFLGMAEGDRMIKSAITETQG